MISHVLLIVSALFALFHLLKIDDKFAKVITAIIAISAGANLAPSALIQQDGFYLFGLTHLLIFFYVFHNEEFELKKRVIIFGMALIQTVAILFMFGGWMHIEIPLIAGIITFLLFTYTLITDIKGYKNELGFLAILGAFGLINFLVGISMVFGLTIY
jgi:hypothetical protein